VAVSYNTWGDSWFDLFDAWGGSWGDTDVIGGSSWRGQERIAIRPRRRYVSVSPVKPIDEDDEAMALILILATE
jgi:hypothetical protein